MIVLLTITNFRRESREKIPFGAYNCINANSLWHEFLSKKIKENIWLAKS